MYCHCKICIATVKYVLPLRKKCLQILNIIGLCEIICCHSETCIVTPKYVFMLRNKHCHSEICIALRNYVLPLRNMHCRSEKKCLPLRRIIGHSEIMYCRSEICIYTPKYNLPLWNIYILTLRIKYFPLQNIINHSQIMYCHSKIYITAPKYILPLRNMYCRSEILYCHHEICIVTPKKNCLLFRNIIGHSAIMHAHSKIYIAVPKQNSRLPEILQTHRTQRTYNVQYLMPSHIYIVFIFCYIMTYENTSNEKTLKFNTKNTSIGSNTNRTGETHNILCYMNWISLMIYDTRFPETGLMASRWQWHGLVARLKWDSIVWY